MSPLYDEGAARHLFGDAIDKGIFICMLVCGAEFPLNRLTQ